MANYEELIVDTCINNATALLKEYREFYPFAYGIPQITGKLVSINVYFGEEYPSSNKVIDELKKGLKESNKENRFACIALCCDILYTENNIKSDALQIEIEFPDKDPVKCIVPYEFKDEKIMLNRKVITKGEKYFDWS